jgi:hypothetical protein
VIFARISSIKDLLPVNLLGTLEMEFKLGEESRYIVPSHEFSSSQEFVDKMEKHFSFDFGRRESMIRTP